MRRLIFIPLSTFLLLALLAKPSFGIEQGACCRPDGGCALEDDEECAGDYQGNDTTLCLPERQSDRR